jgi:hypothetical protein
MSKRHNQILIQSIHDEECSLRNVFRMDLDLMIAQTEIDLAEYFSTGKLIKKNINTEQRILILYGDGIQSPIIVTLPQ